MAIPMCLNLGISGQPFVGSDIGGFIGHPSGELFARWLELGVFTPLMRAHSVINEKNKEPWEYGSAFTDINRETINLRYRLLPYIYTTMEVASSSGIPAMRPMVFEFPDDPRFRETADEFMFGGDLLVAPVLTEGDVQRSVELPEGSGTTSFRVPRWEGEVRHGQRPRGPYSRLCARRCRHPDRGAVQYTGEAPAGPLTLTAFPPAARERVRVPLLRGRRNFVRVCPRGILPEGDAPDVAREDKDAHHRRRRGNVHHPAARMLLVRFMDSFASRVGPDRLERTVVRVERLTGGRRPDGRTTDRAKTVTVTLPDARKAIRVSVEE